MRKEELKKLRAGDELYYVYNHVGYRYRKAVFLRHVRAVNERLGYYYIEVEGRTVCVDGLLIFKREDEAKEYAAKCTKSLIYARLHELGSYFSSLKALGENFLNEEILRNAKVKIVKDFYSVKDKE